MLEVETMHETYPFCMNDSHTPSTITETRDIFIAIFYDVQDLIEGATYILLTSPPQVMAHIVYHSQRVLTQSINASLSVCAHLDVLQ